MGHIKKVLAQGELEPRNLTAGTIWTDLCEDVHLHYRNIRFDYSEKEWAHFRAAINMLGLAVENVADEKNYREGDPNFLVQQIFNVPLKTDSEYYKNRSLIEIQRDNTVHFHYRDLRLHFTQPEFVQIAEMFIEAFGNFRKLKDFPHKGITSKIRDWIKIDLIQPYDAGHRPGVFDEDHREGIDMVKCLIGEGKTIRPILVNDDGQRMDGFKRYMAHRELGIKEIECIINPYAIMGGQHNQSFLED